MVQQLPVMRGLICTPDITLGRAVAALFRASGFEVFGLSETAADAMTALSAAAASGEASPDIIVLDVAACGIRGLPVVHDLHEPCPGCAVAVISPFPSLAPVILDAGASLVVDPSDLRPVLLLLDGMRNEAHAGYPCPCCTPAERSATTASSQAGSSRISKPDSIRGLLWDRPDGSTEDSNGTGSGASGRMEES